MIRTTGKSKSESLQKVVTLVHEEIKPFKCETCD